MPTMTHRKTFVLDKTTAHRLKRLSARWKISQSEVVRHAVAQAESATVPPKPDPVAMLRALHNKRGGIAPARAEKWITEIREDRKHWRDQ